MQWPAIAAMKILGVRSILADEKRWKALPDQVAGWLEVQKRRSILPKREQLLVETFPRGNRFFMVAYPFEGRLAHQTLGMLLTRRLERAKLKPTGFVASDYALGVWGLGDLAAAFARNKPSLAALCDEDMLGDDLDAWMAGTYLLKRGEQSMFDPPIEHVVSRLVNLQRNTVSGQCVPGAQCLLSIVVGDTNIKSST